MQSFHEQIRAFSSQKTIKLCTTIFLGKLKISLNHGFPRQILLTKHPSLQFDCFFSFLLSFFIVKVKNRVIFQIKLVNQLIKVYWMQTNKKIQTLYKFLMLKLQNKKICLFCLFFFKFNNCFTMIKYQLLKIVLNHFFSAFKLTTKILFVIFYVYF